MTLDRAPHLTPSPISSTLSLSSIVGSYATIVRYGGTIPYSLLKVCLQRANHTMAPIARRPPPRSGVQSQGTLLTTFLFLVLFSVILYVAVVPDAGEIPISNAPDLGQGSGGSGKTEHYKQVVGHAEEKLRHKVVEKRHQLSKALSDLSTSDMPARLRALREKHLVVGERLSEVKAGAETVQEVLHSVDSARVTSNKPPMSLDEVINFLTEWIHTLHETLSQDNVKHATYEGIWQAYHDLTVKTLYPWDREYLSRMPPRRDDGSIFLSLATYRDENCLNTVTWAYEKAKNPEKLFVGIVQQNCHSDCKSGVLEGGKIESVEPDQDCFQAFCDGPGKIYCERDQVRKLDIDEPESLGPYAARYFASKMWYGQSYFMQTDAHMTFKQDWDQISVDMLERAPSKKPVISHYPPSEKADLEKMAGQPGSRLCGPIFATSDLEGKNLMRRFLMFVVCCDLMHNMSLL